MATVWKRPESVYFPQTWRTFKGLVEIDGKRQKFWIQDISEDDFDVVIDLMLKKFGGEEGLTTEARDFWREVLEQRLSLICFVKTAHKTIEIVCISINCRAPPSDQNITVSDEFGFSQSMHIQNNDFYEQFNVTEVMIGAGSLTRTDCLNQNVVSEMIKCREMLCKATGIKMNYVIATSTWEEKLKSEGYKVYTALTVEEFDKIFETPIVSEIQCMKLMYKFYE